MSEEFVINTQPVLSYRITLRLGAGATYQDPVTGVNLSIQGYAGGANEIAINITWPDGQIPPDASVVKPGDTVAFSLPYSELRNFAVEFGDFRGEPNNFTIDTTLTSI